MKPIVKTAFLHALATALYVALVASFLYYGGQGAFGRCNTVLVPIGMLMLFVFSAALTGSLVFGRPALWYLDGKKKEALALLASTLGIFFLLMLLAFSMLALFFADCAKVQGAV